MRVKKNSRRAPIILERLEIQSDPFLYESVEVKSRLIGQLNNLFLKEKLNQLRQKYPRASTKEIHKHLSDFLNRLAHREHSNLRFHD